jgi:hypothetical protein
MVTLLEKFRAGDTFLLNFDLQDFPASEGWTLSYILKGPASITIAGSIVDGIYEVEALPTATVNWTSGVYWAFIAVELGGQKTSLEIGKCEILPSLASITTLDGRSHAEKVRDALKSLIEGKASQDVDSYSIAGRSLTKLSPTELLKWLQFYENEVRKELLAEKKQRGEKVSNYVFARFS